MVEFIVKAQDYCHKKNFCICVLTSVNITGYKIQHKTLYNYENALYTLTCTKLDSTKFSIKSFFHEYFFVKFDFLVNIDKLHFKNISKDTSKNR